MNKSSTSSGQPLPPLNETILQIAPQLVQPLQQPTRRPNLPCLDLLEGSREHYFKIGLPLYEAAIKGDWKAAKTILDEQPELVRYAITENHETLLHVAASAGSTKAVEDFVINLVNLMENVDLEIQNKNYDTALSLAAAVGNVKLAKILVQKNRALAEIPIKNRILPLYKAALFAKHDMVRYLYGISKQMSGDFWSPDNRGWVLLQCVEADIFDVAIQIVNDRPELLDKKELLTDVLRALAQKPYAFKGRKPHIIFRIMKSIFHVKIMQGEKIGEALHLLRIICERVAKMHKWEIGDILRGFPKKMENKMRVYPSRVLFLATKMGNTPFLVELIRIYPDAIWKLDDKGKTIFHLAIKCRHADIYNLLNEIGAMKELITPIRDRDGNSMLHMVAKKAKQKSIEDMTTGVALELQRELLWYQEVEQMIPPSNRQRKNKNGETPEELFAKKYANLFKTGEDWIGNYAFVATLIAAIVFAAAFTLPGGYNQDTGIPFFRKEPSLIIFVISDAVSLISSSTCVLIFISIFTSRYAERDYVKSLPSRLLFGIATLFLSIATMMIAFSASFFVLYNKKLEWVPITVTGLACLPVMLFVKMQYHVLVDIFNFTVRPRHIFNPKKRILYY